MIFVEGIQTLFIALAIFCIWHLMGAVRQLQEFKANDLDKEIQKHLDQTASKVPETFIK